MDDDFAEFASAPVETSNPEASSASNNLPDTLDGFGTISPQNVAAGTSENGFDADDAMNAFLKQEREILGENEAQALNSTSNGHFSINPSQENNIPTEAPQMGLQSQRSSVSSFNSSNNIIQVSNNEFNSFHNNDVVIKDYTPEALKNDLDQSSHIQEWKAKHDKNIQERALAAKEQHAKILESAKKDIEQFYKDYELKKSKNQQKNRQQEAEYLRSAGVVSESGIDSSSPAKANVWDRVSKYIDFSASGTGNVKKDAKVVPNSANNSSTKRKSKTSGPLSPNDPSGSLDSLNSRRDLSKFKSMLFQLKNDPKSPGNFVTMTS